MPNPPACSREPKTWQLTALLVCLLHWPSTMSDGLLQAMSTRPACLPLPETACGPHILCS